MMEIPAKLLIGAMRICIVTDWPVDDETTGVCIGIWYVDGSYCDSVWTEDFDVCLEHWGTPIRSRKAGAPLLGLSNSVTKSESPYGLCEECGKPIDGPGWKTCYPCWVTAAQIEL